MTMPRIPALLAALLALVLGCLAAGPAAAQVPATLVADSVVLTADGRLVAEGNVEVFYDGTRLSASRVSYDRAADRLIIDGPILVAAADGTVFSATQATLDPRLESGILLGARLVLDRQLQLAAGRIDRQEGRFTTLTQAAVTSCRVCPNRPPLWEIRAGQVIHDEAAQLLYFENAQFRIRGVPVFWLPRLRMPDPSQDRATGFLTPRIRSTDQLGTGILLPYFIRLGQSRDLTLTPYLSTRTRTLNLRYRQAFDRGVVQFEGAVSEDSLEPEGLRGYATLTGAFQLPRDFRLTFDLEAVTDRAYLLDYGLSGTDVLQSEIALLRVRDREYFRGALTVFESLREGDNSDALPGVVGDLRRERRRFLEGGGILTIASSADLLYRVEDDDGTGRDMIRSGHSLDWRRNWISRGGLVTAAEARVGIDNFRIRQDPSFDRSVLRGNAGGAVTLRWPLIGTDRGGAVHVLEPVAQVAWSDSFGAPVPNEDSTLSEFDEGNLLALSRFAGEDRLETGLRGAAGLSWSRSGPRGWRSTLTFGRVFRAAPEPDFSETSGLRGTRSDWLIAGNIRFGQNLAFAVRSLMQDDTTFTRTEARLDWTGARVNLAAVYVFLPADADEDRAEPVSEWTFDADWDISAAWSVSAEARYDLVADAPARAALGANWRNECVEVGLSVSRRYTSSANVEPVTDYGLSVELLGFAADAAGPGPARRCSG